MLRSQRGLTLIELMIGLVLGLLVTGVAVQMYVSSLSITKQTTATVRLNQELRAIADLIVGDVRRAGYWSEATSGNDNPYASLVSGGESASGYIDLFDPVSGGYGCLILAYENAGLTPSLSEHIYGYRLNTATDAIQILTVSSYASSSFANCNDPSGSGVTGVWETLSDSRVVNNLSLVFRFSPSSAASWAQASDKVIEFDLSAAAPGDASIVRQISESVRVRNEYTY